jgi:hypothetical protein
VARGACEIKSLIRAVFVGSLDPPLAHGGGQDVNQATSLFPTDAGVGYALTVDELLAGDQILTAGLKVAFDHDAENPRIAQCNLRRDVVTDFDLIGRIFATVAVAAVDHDARGYRRLSEIFGRGVDVGVVIVRLLAAAQDDVTVLIAHGRNNRRVAGLGNRQEMMRRMRGANRVERDSYIAVGAVLEADRT